jgi:hypothetical protein
LETETENKRHTEENLRPAEAVDQKAGSEPAKYSEDGANADEQGHCDKLAIGPLKRDGEVLDISAFGKDITERKHG